MSERRVILLFLMVLGLAGGLASGGCSKRAEAEKEFESDSNAYFCPACGLKFYTDRDVFAEHCPECEELEIQDVMGYLCGQQHVTPAVRGARAVVCAECGEKTDQVRLPRSEELETWGAVKKGQEAVSLPLN